MESGEARIEVAGEIAAAARADGTARRKREKSG